MGTVNQTSMEVEPKSIIEPRTIFIQLNALDSIKGSAYMEYGNTKVMVVIEPPREITVQQRNIEIPCQINCTTNFLPKAFDDITLLKNKESSLSISLKKVLESSICRYKFANMQLDIKVTVLEDDGCALSTAINCAGAALVVAGIPTFDIIAASTIGYYNETEYINPDVDTEKLFTPSSDEKNISKNYGVVTVASFPSFRQVTGCFQRGMLLKSTFAPILNHTLEINEKISLSLKHAFVNNVKKILEISES